MSRDTGIKNIKNMDMCIFLCKTTSRQDILFQLAYITLMWQNSDNILYFYYWHAWYFLSVSRHVRYIDDNIAFQATWKWCFLALNL